MEPIEPFALFDCSLARCATGKSCTNLRELLDLVMHGSDASLEHHMMHCALDHHFELYEFPNDLARWCWDGLGDDVLAEQLGLIDPYQLPSVAELRTAPLYGRQGLSGRDTPRPYYGDEITPRDAPLYPRVAPVTDEQIARLPDERYGLVMVFRTFDRAAFALVMQASRQVSVNDLLTNP